MRQYLLAAFLAIVSTSSLAVQLADIEAFAAKIEKPLQEARYMEGSCTPTTIAGWEGLGTLRCNYSVKDKKTGIAKDGLVVLLDPSAKQLSAWILNACETVRPKEKSASCAQRLFHQVIWQSGGQFPIAGIVYEDILPKDGIQEAYGFACGVTTVLQGVKHRQTKPFTKAELELALNATPIKTASDAAFARIAGVSRIEYLKKNPTANVAKLNWLTVVCDEHKKAMKNDRNALLEAWLSANAP